MGQKKVVSAVCEWGSDREGEVEVERIKGRRTWSRNSIDRINLAFLKSKGKKRKKKKVRERKQVQCWLFKTNSVWVNV